ncbi:hypothetical protein [Sandaracinus amylolyticus]|uniref:CcmD family protein n=1 Tax=Sandaracinus amylolyticus TaxID=927083 RepID=A0A0F6SH32_9BACT|nr:hypothetical protein [Sandaracinus amylolyticus]AKF09739.1 hypothetical protein DB32_006888 [Sandaracinus amylolyticus]
MKTIRALMLAAFVVLVPLATALAQDGEPRRETAAESRATSFQAVEGPSTEDVPGGPLLVGAYGTILVLLLAYVAWLGRLQSTTARDLDRLQKALDRAPAPKAE